MLVETRVGIRGSRLEGNLGEGVAGIARLRKVERIRVECVDYVNVEGWEKLIYFATNWSEGRFNIVRGETNLERSEVVSEDGAEIFQAFSCLLPLKEVELIHHVCV